MTSSQTGNDKEPVRRDLRGRWRVALAAIAVTGAVAMTGWALGAPPGGALPSGVRPAEPASPPQNGGMEKMRVLVPTEQAPKDS
ncbi:hypothetical protein [Actinocorallia libanotica]|uniref:Uncharacterized protein n=1 Tax=Actinocorallia libanotica TaxID=46162 RepID=A0ABN1Q6E4_9ACTN